MNDAIRLDVPRLQEGFLDLGTTLAAEVVKRIAPTTAADSRYFTDADRFEPANPKPGQR